ncbi:MAG: SpvB/TcaC N-terminal domain-containing protein, partial [Acidimicrobiia bacterium]
MRERPGLLALLFLSAVSFAPSALATTTDTRAQTENTPFLAVSDAARVSLFSGAASYAYPFELPPGTGGLTPALALVYSSSAGHGESGYGWGLNLGAIERSNQQGVPTYTASDTFALDGELLVQGPDWNGTTPRYFKRIHDGTRILYLESQDIWEVTDGSGITYRYGSRPESRLKNGPSGTGSTFRWNLDEVEDPAGNSYRIEYEPLDTYTIPGGTWKTWLYPRRVRYSYHDGAFFGPQTVRLAVLRWQLRGDGCGATVGSCLVGAYPNGPYPTEDRPTSYRSGFKVQKNWRLAEVDVGFDTSGNGDIEAGERIRRYALSYSPKTSGANPDLPPFSRLDSIQRYGSDDRPFPRTANAATHTLPPLPTTFTYTGNAVDVGADPDTTRSFQRGAHPFPFNPIRGGLSNSVDSSGTQYGMWDMNGDGILDWVAVGSGGHLEVFPGSSTGYDNDLDFDGSLGFAPGCYPIEDYIEKSNLGGDGYEVQTAGLIDLNGDGLPDRVTTPNQATFGLATWCWWKNNGLGFDDVQAWVAPSWVEFPRNGLQANTPGVESPPGSDAFRRHIFDSLLADVNGDGRPDFLTSNSVALNNGSGFDSFQPWSKEERANVSGAWGGPEEQWAFLFISGYWMED